MLTTVLFDMDGVLCDSRQPIATCIRFALERHGLVAPADEALYRYIGPPLRDAFELVLANLGADVTRAGALVETYRERYRVTSVAETPAFAGVAELLDRLAPRFRLAVVTSKPLDFARPILAARGLDRHMAHIEGPTLDTPSEAKAITLSRALVALGAPALEGVVMIGDREHDVIAARANGVGSLGVLWGIGSRAELEAAGAGALLSTPAELGEHLLARAS